MAIQSGWFTIVQPGQAGTDTETRLNFRYSDTTPKWSQGGVVFTIEGVEFKVGPQQLMELGALFLALGGTNVDFDSASELLDGFNLKGLDAAEQLVEALK